MHTLSLPAPTASAQTFTYAISMHMELFFLNFIAEPLLRQCSEKTLEDQDTCPDLAYANPDRE